MAVKVVQGLIGSSQADYNPLKKTAVEAQSVTEQAVRAASSPGAARNAVAATHVAANEAVVTNIRASRTSGTSEKVRDPKVAKQLAEAVAEQIRGNPSSIGAHQGLQGVTAQSHLME